MRIWVCLLIVTFFLVACTTSIPSIPPPITQTSSASSLIIQSSSTPLQPTSTLVLPTLTPFPPTSTPANPTRTPVDTLQPDENASLELGPILVQPGDLPEGYTPGEVTDTIPGYFDLQNTICNSQIYQGFEQNGENAGGVTIVRCKTYSQTMFSIGYDMAVWGDVKRDVQDIGSDIIFGTLNKNNNQGVEGLNVLFLRCNLVVYIRMTGTVNEESILSYAKKLDERLSTLPCDD